MVIDKNIHIQIKNKDELNEFEYLKNTLKNIRKKTGRKTLKVIKECLVKFEDGNTGNIGY